MRIDDSGNLVADTATNAAGATLTVDFNAGDGEANSIIFKSASTSLSAANVPLSVPPGQDDDELAGTTGDGKFIAVDVSSEIDVASGESELEWTRFGTWSTAPSQQASENGEFQTGSVWVAGYQTPGANIPVSGSATYRGVIEDSAVVYRTATGLAQGELAATTDITANFANRTLTGNFTNVSFDTETDVHPWNDLSFSASYGAGSNSISGTAVAGTSPGTTGSLATGTTGTLAGHFYGPSAQEVGLVVSIGNSDGSVAALATIIGKQ